MCLTLWPHGLQHARFPFTSLSPGVCSNSCPSSWWCHPTISSSVLPFSSPQSFPASGSFPVSQLFTSGGQSVGASASSSVLPMSIQGWFPLGLTGLNLIHLYCRNVLVCLKKMSQIYKYWPGNTFMTYYMNNHTEDWYVLHNPILLKTEFYRECICKIMKDIHRWKWRKI